MADNGITLAGAVGSWSPHNVGEGAIRLDEIEVGRGDVGKVDSQGS